MHRFSKRKRTTSLIYTRSHVPLLVTKLISSAIYSSMLSKYIAAAYLRTPGPLFGNRSRAFLASLSEYGSCVSENGSCYDPHSGSVYRYPRDISDPDDDNCWYSGSMAITRVIDGRSNKEDWRWQREPTRDKRARKQEVFQSHQESTGANQGRLQEDREQARQRISSRGVNNFVYKPAGTPMMQHRHS